MTLSAVSSPEASAACTILRAIRSFVDPVGLFPSSLAHRRTPGLGDMCGMPTSGVFPIASRMSSNRVTDGLSQCPHAGHDAGRGVAGWTRSRQRRIRGPARFHDLLEAIDDQRPRMCDATEVELGLRVGKPGMPEQD